MSITNLVQFNSSGLVVPTFTQIRSAIIENYKEAYGSDIDLSTGSADGVFVNNLALMMRSLTDAMKNLYANLDVNYAQGVYLDALCALSNVTRRAPTYSNASISVTNPVNASSDVTIDSSVRFIDKSGIEWIPQGSVTIAPDTTASIQVVCSVLGPIEAPAGWINRTIQQLSIVISQPNAANVGLAEETDDELRARRLQSVGAQGITVLQSLVGALTSISGIDDVSIYNNEQTVSFTSKDGTSVLPHSIYVIIRRHPGISVADRIIGTTIYNKLTPGIGTVQSNITADRKSYEVEAEMMGIQLTTANQMIYWKEASKQDIYVRVVIVPNSNFANPANTSGIPSEYDKICPQIMQYLNGLLIGTDINTDQLTLECTRIDPMKYGRKTYDVTNVLYSSDGTNYSTTSISNPDSYYNFTSWSVTPGTTGSYNITFH